MKRIKILYIDIGVHLGQEIDLALSQLKDDRFDVKVEGLDKYILMI